MSRSEPVQLSIGVITDMHLAGRDAAPRQFNNPVRRAEARGLLAAALAWVSARADALILLGDLADSPSPDIYDELRSRVTAAGLPTYAVAGNHDLSPHADHLGRLFCPDSSGRRVHRLGRATLAAGMTVASAALRSTGSGAHYLQFPDDAEEVLAGDGLLIWASHFPVLSLRAAVESGGWMYAGDMAGAGQARARLQRHAGPVVALTGHLHVRAHAIDGNILQLSNGALAESPHDVGLVEIAVAGGVVTVTRTCHSLAGFGSDLPAVLDGRQTGYRWAGGSWRRRALAR